jgi:hypothetical protein
MLGMERRLLAQSAASAFRSLKPFNTNPMNKYIALCLLSLLAGCTSTPANDPSAAETVIDFGNIHPAKASDIIGEITFIALETTESSIVGDITQIEIHKDKIYALDAYGSRTLYIFAIDGQYINKLEGNGNGPGEFMNPHSFWIDPDGFILILDWEQSKLLRYSADDYTYIDDITLPYPSPLSFSAVPDTDLYAYYHPFQAENDEKRVTMADKNGTVASRLLAASAPGNILHGTQSNFYILGHTLNIYPYFSNKIYLLQKDSAHCRYELFWGDTSFPPEDLYTKHADSRMVMNELMTGDNNWIRLIYVYETDTHLIVKYYIKKDFYLSVYNKNSAESIHFKHASSTDDLGLGGKIPLPSGIAGNRIISEIKLHELDADKVTNPALKKLLKDKSSEDNSILALYTLKSH